MTLRRLVTIFAIQDLPGTAGAIVNAALFLSKEATPVECGSKLPHSKSRLADFIADRTTVMLQRLKRKADKKTSLRNIKHRARMRTGSFLILPLQQLFFSRRKK